VLYAYYRCEARHRDGTTRRRSTLRGRNTLDRPVGIDRPRSCDERVREVEEQAQREEEGGSTNYSDRRQHLQPLRPILIGRTREGKLQRAGGNGTGMMVRPSEMSRLFKREALS
jgi:hypothetical protein